MDPVSSLALACHVNSAKDASMVDSGTSQTSSVKTSMDASICDISMAEKGWAVGLERPQSVHLLTRRSLDLMGYSKFPESVRPPPSEPIKTLQGFWTTYRIIFAIIFSVNLVSLVLLLCTDDPYVTFSDVSTAVAANLFVCVLARFEHLVNILFIVCCHMAPKTSPLWLRHRLAGVFGYGGLHSGCAVAAVAWYIWYIGLVARSYVVGAALRPAITIVSCVTLTLLLMMLAWAHPTLRARFHNGFEMSHRFAGWAVVVLFWIQIIYLTIDFSPEHNGLGLALAHAPAFWLLLGTTLLLVYPWTRLRKRSVTPEPLSDHAVRLHFHYGHVGYGMALKIADRPLCELHAFAVIPRPTATPGFSVVVSNAGDWTANIIRNPPTQLWTRGVPQYGVLRVAALFRPVLLIATGSGIGPCLSLFIAQPNLPCRVLWSTREPVATYGAAILARVYQADPAATVIDTSKHRRPDLVGLAQQRFRQCGAEAAVVISNRHVTRQVVYGLNQRGCTAFGPLFDS